MAKPIGGKIKTVCHTADGNEGWTDCPMMRKVFNCPAAEAHVYLNRAVGLGLLDVDRSHYPQRYWLKEGWKAKVEPAAPKPVASAARLPDRLPKAHDLQRVWM